MDILSHGLYGGIAFGRNAKVSYWTAFFFGIMPDLFSFGIFMVLAFLGPASGLDRPYGPHDPATFPSYVYQLYDIGHSLIIACGVFGIVWLVLRKPVLELLAWPLHILIDIPSHSSEFFPTPFLWPLSDYTVNGISWGNPHIFFPNIMILFTLYTVWYLRHRRNH